MVVSGVGLAAHWERDKAINSKYCNVGDNLHTPSMEKTPSQTWVSKTYWVDTLIYLHPSTKHSIRMFKHKWSEIILGSKNINSYKVTDN